MKSNKGMGMIQLIIVIVLIVIVVLAGGYLVKTKYGEVRNETVRTDMLHVQWKLKGYIDDKTAKGEEITYLGTKVSESKEDVLIQEFLSKNIIAEEEYEKYYVLRDEDLATAKLEITNYEGSYYLINYDTYEVIITKGCQYGEDEVLYKLSDIEQKNVKEENNNTQDNIVEETEIENKSSEEE